VVRIEDPLTFAHWHMGLVDWAAALRTGGIQVSGPGNLSRALPTWNAGPATHARLRAEHDLPTLDRGVVASASHSSR
jgi:hypothetical protein